MLAYFLFFLPFYLGVKARFRHDWYYMIFWMLLHFSSSCLHLVATRILLEQHIHKVGLVYATHWMTDWIVKNPMYPLLISCVEVAYTTVKHQWRAPLTTQCQMQLQTNWTCLFWRRHELFSGPLSAHWCSCQQRWGALCGRSRDIRLHTAHLHRVTNTVRLVKEINLCFAFDPHSLQ